MTDIGSEIHIKEVLFLIDVSGVQSLRSSQTQFERISQLCCESLGSMEDLEVELSEVDSSSYVQ